MDSGDGDCAHEGALADAPVLRLARYAPSTYRLDDDAEKRAREAQLAGLLRSGLLKRFESSAHAFASTCERMAESHTTFLTLLDRGDLATGEALESWATDTEQQGFLDEDLLVTGRSRPAQSQQMDMTHPLSAALSKPTGACCSRSRRKPAP